MENLIKQIDRKIESYADSLIEDTVRLVNIKSEQGKPEANAPFGKGPKKVLDTVWEMAEKEGLFTKDYGVGVISAAMYDTQPDLGIWLHADVVPAGEGWIYPPYDATLYKDCIIGRGATDNKGQLAAIFNLFKIFKELNINLKYNPALYVGSNEENGMKDLTGVEGNLYAKGFNNVCEFPKMSLVPDSGFPVGYGGKGLATFKLKSRTKLHGFKFTAGQKQTPGVAEAVFDTLDFPDALGECDVKKSDKSYVSIFTPPRHTASPDPDGNMITKLSDALLNAGVVQKEDRYILEFFKAVSLDAQGKMLGIYRDSKLMVPTTVYAQTIDCNDGFCELTIKVRFPIETTYDEMKEKLSAKCDEMGFDVIGMGGHKPFINDNLEMVNMLCQIANSVTGDDKKPYVAGVTYAHYLPNAYVFGMNGCKVPDDFLPGHGSAHGVDECVSIERLKRAMRIYARTLLELNNTEW